jgi:dicarboxylate transporter 10
VVGQTIKIVKGEGFLGLYNGLSASLVRQLTYSTTRFAIYEVAKQRVSPNGEPISFQHRLLMAAVAGGCGGFVGTPGDMVNVRMQNDIKLPKDQRRNYKHAIDGMARVAREEGFRKLFSGVDWATGRAILMTIGQLCFYDQVKIMLLSTDHFTEGVTTHFTASLCAGAIATTMTQPLDVLKTRSMNAKPGEFSSSMQLIKYTAASGGPMAFYKGYIPAFVRLGPQTILTFILFEQLRMNFGFVPEQK